MIFLDHGKRLEYSMGSAALGWLCFVIGIAANVIFCMLSYILYGITADKGVLFRVSAGLYTILFGTLALDATQAPRTSERRLCFVNVPTLYFPVALLVFFSVLGRLSFSCLISMGIGYVIGLVEPAADAIKLSSTKAKEWEDSILQNFCRRPGWVYGHASTGQDAWNGATGGLVSFLRNERTNSRCVLHIFVDHRTSLTPFLLKQSLPSFLTRNTNNRSDSSSGGPSSTSVPSGSVATASPTAFGDLADGRVLGGASGSGGAAAGTATTRRGAAEARAARLEALERGEASRKSAALGSGLL